MKAPFEEKKIEREVHHSLTEFLAEGDWGELRGLDEEAVTSFLKVFLDAAWRDLGVRPTDLEPSQIREILLVHMPRRIGAKRAGAGRAVEVIECFYHHLKAEHGFKAAEGTPEVLAEAREKFPGLLETGAAEEEARLAAPALRREDEKVGRNDPCPCGSGKKYKKCCAQS